MIFQRNMTRGILLGVFVGMSVGLSENMTRGIPLGVFYEMRHIYVRFYKWNSTSSIF